MNHRSGTRPKGFIEAVVRAPLEHSSPPITLLAVCPVSEAVVEANLIAAAAAAAPAIFTATLNQVDVDGGYTGRTPENFVSETRALANQVAPGVPVLFGIDHAGPWRKDADAAASLSLDESLANVRASLRAALTAGYCWTHLDTTRSLDADELPAPELMADRTVELVEFCEHVRPDDATIFYEVGVEEVGSAQEPDRRLHEFLSTLTEKLRERGLPPPTFAVGDLGTRIDTDLFDEKRTRRIVAVARTFGMGVKAHYSDGLKHPEQYPQIGIAAANIGPGLAGVEVDALIRLQEQIGDVAPFADFKRTLHRALDESGRWRKWVSQATEMSTLADVPEDLRQRLLHSGSRYVLSSERVQTARRELFDAVRNHAGVDPHRYVVARLETALTRFYESFNLVGLVERLDVAN